MCGIVGILNKSKDVDKDILTRMTDSIQHRGPDAGKIWIDSRIGFGHRRLSIIDLSSSANQPFIDNTNNFVIVFNGEIYNFQSIKDKLVEKYKFQTNSDTEVVLYSFIEWGKDCLQYFNGMFAFAIWDIYKQELFVVRDRLGIKPFYYALTDEGFVFSSEIRPILHSGKIEKKLDENGLIEYLSYQTVNAPNTIIKAIKQLEPGQYGFLRKEKLSINSYWSLKENTKKYEGQTREKVKKDIKSLFYEAVERRMISDVPLGAFLSGGIDSSAIVGAMAELSTTKLSTFSIGFHEKEFDESNYAQIIANKFKTDHHNIKLSSKDFLSQIPSILPSFDIPSGDGVNTYIVSKLVKEKGITVALSGLGGDELFAGYDSFKRHYRLNQIDFLWNLPVKLRLASINIIKSRIGKYQEDRLKEIFSEDNYSVASIHPYMRRLLPKTAINKLITIDADYVDRYKEKLNQLNLKELDILSQVSIGEISGYTQNVLLRDTDQMSMAHALEVRVPFFDHSLVEYVLGIPNKLKFPKYSKQLLVESLSLLLPNEIVHRKKMGFSFPWDHWLRTHLKDFCEVSLNNLIVLPYFNEEALKDMWNRFLMKDPTIKWSHIWILVNLGCWVRTNQIEK